MNGYRRRAMDLLRTMARTIRRHAPLAIPYVALAILVRAWFLPGLISAEDFNAIPWADQAMLQHYFPWPESWDPTIDLGSAMDLYMPMFPVLVIMGALTKLGLGWPVIQRLVFLFPLFVLLPLTPYLLAFRITRSRWAAAAAALVFAINPWVVSSIEIGFIPALLAYALAPLSLLAAIAVVRKNSTRATVAVAVITLAQTCFEPRFTYMSLLMIGAFVVMEAITKPRQRLTRQFATKIALFLAIVISGSMYWLIPTVFSPTAVWSSYLTLKAFVSSSGWLSLIDSYTLFHPYYHEIMSANMFIVYPVDRPFVVIGLLISFSLILCARRPIARAVALIWILGVIFLSGPTSAFGALNQWLFMHVPGLSAFRDASKMYFVVNTAASLALAIMFSSLPGLKLSGLTLRRRTVATVAVLAFVSFYLFAMYDAYNPLRLSNFSAVVATAADHRLQEYIATNVPRGRILFFPEIPQYYRFDDQHPAIASRALATGWPFGLGALNPDESSINRFYASPLSSSLLCELGIRYTVLVTDPNTHFFVPWQLEQQRGEVLQFLNSRSWLSPVDLGLGGLPIDQRPLLYKINGCSSDPERLGFMAPYPVVFDASSSYLEALNGSVFWSRDPAVVIAREQSRLPPYDAVHNVVTGAEFADPNDTRDYPLPYTEQQSLLREGARRVLHQPFQYHGFAFDREAQGRDERQPVPPGLLKESFTTHEGKAQIDAVITPEYPLTQKVDTSTTLRPIPETPGSARKLLVDPSGFITYAGSGFAEIESPDQPAGWLQIENGGAVFNVVNPLTQPVVADITIPGAVALSGAWEPYTVSVAGTDFWNFALSQVLHRSLGGAVPFTMRSVRLLPGSTTLTVTPEHSPIASPSAPSILAIDPHIQVINVRPSGEPQRYVPLAVSLEAVTGGGSRLRIASDQNPDYPAEARFRAFSDMSMPLNEHQDLRVRYISPADPVNYDVALGLSGPAGKIEFVTALPGGLHTFTIKAFEAVQRAFDATREQERKLHRLDYQWLRDDQYKPQDEASSYVLEYVDLLVTKPASRVAAGAVGSVRSFDLIANQTGIASPVKEYRSFVDFTRLPVPVALRTQNVNVESIVKSQRSFSMVASLHRLAQESVPSQLQVGDNATLTLSNGTSVSGLITSADQNTIVVKTGESYTGVRRDTIATISHVFPDERERLSFVVPVDVPPAATNLEFAVAQDPSLKPTFTFLVRSQDSRGVTEIVPQDRALTPSRKPELPPEWQALEPDLGSVTALNVDLPLTPIDLIPRIPVRTRYSFPLSDIFASEMPQARAPRVVGIRLTFEASNTDTRGAHNVMVEVADVAATSASVSTGSEKNWDVGAAPLELDGRPLALRSVRTVGFPLGSATLASADADLSAGKHAVTAGAHAPAVVQTALISIGSPVAGAAADLHDSGGNSFSERYGDLNTGGGMLVMPVTYAPSWQLALVPPALELSGNPVLDYIRVYPYLQPMSAKVRVNGGLNGWVVPAFHGRAVFIYAKAFWSVVGLLLQLAVVGAWIVAYRRWGGSRARRIA